jgi:glutaredoxin
MKRISMVRIALVVPCVFLLVLTFGVNAQEPESPSGESIEEGVIGEESEQNMVLYVQEGCNHCAKVEEFLEENGLIDELTIRDTSVDPDASEEYVNELERLGVPLEESGVPMLVYDGDQYLTGDTPIISLLEERYEIKTPEDDPLITSTSDYITLGAGVLFVGGILGYGIVKVINDKRSDD